MKRSRALLLSVLGLAGAGIASAADFQCPVNRETVALFLQQRFAEAVPGLRKQLEGLPATSEGDTAKARVCVTTQLASALSQVRELDEAVEMQRANVEVARRLVAEDDRLLLEAQMHLATIQQKRGEYDASIPVLRSLVPRIEKAHGPRSLELVTVLRNTATALHWVGNFADAVPYDERRVRILRQWRPGTDCAPAFCARALADAQASLGDTLRRVRRDAEAEEHLRSALRIYEGSGPGSDPQILDARLTLASILGNLGRRTEAEEIEHDVARIAERTLGPRHALTQKAKGNLAVTLSGKEPETAVRMEEERLGQMLARPGPMQPDALMALHNLAVSSIRTGDTARALSLLHTGVVALLARPDSLDFDDQSRAAFERWQAPLTDEYLLQLLRAGRIPDAFLFTEQLKARNLAAHLGTLDMARGMDAEVLARRRELRGRIARADQAVALARSTGRSDAAPVAARAQLALQWNEAQPAAGERLAERGNVPRWTGRLFTAAPAVVSFRFVRNRLLAFVVERDRQRAFQLDAEDIVRPTVEALRLAMREAAATQAGTLGLPLWKTAAGGYTFSIAPITGTTRAGSVDEVLAFLHAKLMAPLLPHLPAQNKLLISVDGNLAHVPFDALPHEGGRLGDRYEIAVLPSFAMHETLSARREQYRGLQREPLLAVGGAPYSRVERIAPGVTFLRERPVLQEMDLKVAMQAVRKNPALLPMALANVSLGWADLPGTVAEVELVSRALAGGGPARGLQLVKEQASEASLNALAAEGRLQRFRYIHFAAHGFLSDDEPALSAVVLSQVRREPGTDGYLTAVELAAMNLHADLVVVSACDSGASPAANATGSTGFAAALFEAGANGSILTLWPVPDRDTPQFMQRLYQHLAQGDAPPAALQKTRTWARGQGMPQQLVNAFVYWGLH